jgi:peptide/nickel transport system permease protein
MSCWQLIPSWGGMLQEGGAQINIAWWLTTFPGLAIMLTVTGFNFVGDWLRDRLDPGTETRE